MYNLRENPFALLEGPDKVLIPILFIIAYILGLIPSVLLWGTLNHSQKTELNAVIIFTIVCIIIGWLILLIVGSPIMLCFVLRDRCNRGYNQIG
jgi:tryptophan-rich sensory protein